MFDEVGIKYERMNLDISISYHSNNESITNFDQLHTGHVLLDKRNLEYDIYFLILYINKENEYISGFQFKNWNKKDFSKIDFSDFERTLLSYPKDILNELLISRDLFVRADMFRAEYINKYKKSYNKLIDTLRDDYNITI